jgi:ubiquinone/menaquinone biosynthesis C-methylase UbiE
MARVVKPGGRVVVLDRDIETRTIDVPDRALTRRILNFWCDSFLGGWIGRQLPRLFREAGLSDVTVEPVTVIDRDFAAFDAQYNPARIVERVVSGRKA